jgi:PD-(D/E)XK endonuclease
MEHPKDIGDRSVLAAILALRLAGYAVLVPFGENTRYDAVIDDGDRLARVQVKTGRLRGGAIRFAACSAYGHHRNPQASRRSYRGQVDYFVVYCPDTGGVYLIPIGAVPVNVQGALRVQAPRNNQRKRIRLASDYEIASIPLHLPEPRGRGATAGLAASAGAR